MDKNYPKSLTKKVAARDPKMWIWPVKNFAILALHTTSLSGLNHVFYILIWNDINRLKLNYLIGKNIFNVTKFSITILLYSVKETSDIRIFSVN